VVCLCFELWQKLNPEYRFVVLDGERAGEVLATLGLSRDAMGIQALSDVLRVNTLFLTGGIWVDAAVLPVRPVKAWLPPIRRGDFFAFSKPGPDRALSSWFLAAGRDSYIMHKWWDEVVRYWDRPRRLLMDPRQGDSTPRDPVLSVSPQEAGKDDTYPYFWVHYLFGFALQEDEQFRSAWSHCEDVSALPPHELQSLLRQNRMPNDETILTALRRSPVHKLDWRETYPVDQLKYLTLTTAS